MRKVAEKMCNIVHFIKICIKVYLYLAVFIWF